MASKKSKKNRGDSEGARGEPKQSVPAGAPPSPAAAEPTEAAPGSSSTESLQEGTSEQPSQQVAASQTISDAPVPSAQLEVAGVSGPSTPPEPPPVRRPVVALLGVTLLAGLLITTYLTRVHLGSVYGKESTSALCDFGSGFNCSDVISSQYATLFGVLPWSVLAIPAYAMMFMLTLRAFALRERKSLGAIALLGAFSSALSVWLFYVSKVLIGVVCPFCMSMYGVNLLALILPVIACRESLGTVFVHGFRALGDRRLVALSAANFLLIFALAWGGYSSAKSNLIQQQIDNLTGGSNRPSSAADSGSTPGKPGVPVTPGARKDVRIDASVPTAGAANAPVKIVAFEDFQCGFCKKLAGNLGMLEKKFPTDVQVAFRHFPMHLDCNEGGIKRSMHPDACMAAMASVCAHQQGRFWEYHDSLFKNSRALGRADLRAYATELALDMTTFDQCLSDPATLAKVKEDSREGGALGVSGTPTFFVNGRQFSGAQSLEVLSALVESEAKGVELSMAELREIKAPDITGHVEAPETVSLQGPDGPFEIDTFEASIEGGKAVSRAGAQPATNVTWFEANQACQAAGKRLCTDVEWMTACTGAIPVDSDGNGDFTDDRLTGTTYPYGDYYKAGFCNDQVEAPKDASATNPPPLPALLTGNHPECRSKQLVYDLTGNVREWTGFVAPKSAYMGGAFYSRDEAACLSRSESAGPFHKQEALGFRCCRGGNPKDRITHPGRQVGETLSQFGGTLLDGSRFDSSSLKGRVTLLTFWASWCGPCREELPAYASIYPELEKKGFRLLAINVDQDPEKARAFLQKIPVNFPVLMDSDNSLLQSFDTKAMPTSFLINGKGQVLLRKTGFEKGDEKRLVKTVEKLLMEAQ